MREISLEDAKFVSGAGRWDWASLPNSGSPSHPFGHETSLATPIIQGAVGSMASIIGQSIVNNSPSNVTCTLLGGVSATVVGAISAPGLTPLGGIALGGVTGGLVRESCNQFMNSKN